MSHKQDIDETYMVPMELISCPGCGERYGHNGTKVDMISAECSECVDRMCYVENELINADEFIHTILYDS
jgi:hypothetical protein